MGASVAQMFYDAGMAIPTWLIPAIIIGFALYKVAVVTIAYVNSLWIEGKPNEWVVIMRNGDFVQAGIGLSTFVGPFDQVAIFPSKHFKSRLPSLSSSSWRSRHSKSHRKCRAWRSVP